MTSLAEELRPYTADAMKIEVAPWIRDYVVDMEDLYSELKLEKLHNKPFGISEEPLNDYKELFVKSEQELELTCFTKGSVTSKFPSKQVKFCHKATQARRARGKKVLVKGKPGIGKTTLLKKIGWDWANGVFWTYAIVFFVFLKLVKPGDAIENVIIDQMPELEGMNVSPRRLREILNTVGPRCLIIFDGLDEHALGLNEDVLKIIKGQKLLYSNIVVSSRPHTTRGIENYFQTIVRVDGFTRREASKFAFKVLNDKQKVSEVLNFNPADFRQDVFLHHYPILLSFMCLLVLEDDIDLSSQAVTIGEIYFRMVRCLYKKFTIRKGINYDVNEFIRAITAIGKLAFQMLLSGNSFLRSEVVREVGEDAFDYGLLIGHEDFRLIRDETADMLVTFPHRTLQEFLAAFYFIFAISGKTVESVLGKSTIIRDNPLFLDFCLWILYIGKEYVPLQYTDSACDSLTGYFAGVIDNKLLTVDETSTKLPNFNIPTACRSNHSIRLKFFAAVLCNCHTKLLIVQNQKLLDWILTAMRPVLRSIDSIYVGHSSRLCCLNNSALTLDVMNLSQPLLNVVQKHSRYFAKKASLYLRTYKDEQVDVSKLFADNVIQLHLSGSASFLTLSENIPLCFSLSRISFFNQRLSSEFISYLSQAVQIGHLPCLSHLAFVECKGLESSIPLLFRSQWPELSHLNLFDTRLDEKDFEFLSRAISDTNGSPIPKLTDLVLSNFHCDPVMEVHSLLKNALANLTGFHLGDPQSLISKVLINAIKQAELPNVENFGIFLREQSEDKYLETFPFESFRHVKSLSLFGCVGLDDTLFIIGNKLAHLTLRKLDLSNNRAVGGNLAMLLQQKFPFLENLILRDCDLDSDDLFSLSQFSAKGGLPELKHLDISHNTGSLESFCDGSKLWVRGLLVAVGRCNAQVRLSLIYISGNLLDLRYLGSL